MTTTGPTRPAPTLPLLHRLLLRLQVTRGRLVGLGLLSITAVVLAAVTRGADDPTTAGVELIAGYGLGVVAPVCTLWIAASVLGDLVEDRTLVYLWLRPVARWQIAVAGLAAVLTLVVPLVGVPLVIAAAVTGASGAVAGTALSTGLALVAYGGAFLALGARVRRALWWGLGYVLVWENSVARISDGTARLAIRSYTETVLSDATDVELRLADRSLVASIVVPLLVGAVATWWCGRVLQRREVD